MLKRRYSSALCGGGGASPRVECGGRCFCEDLVQWFFCNWILIYQALFQITPSLQGTLFRAVLMFWVLVGRISELPLLGLDVLKYSVTWKRIPYDHSEHFKFTFLLLPFW